MSWVGSKAMAMTKAFGIFICYFNLVISYLVSVTVLPGLIQQLVADSPSATCVDSATSS